MKAIIVDDETRARQMLRAMLADLCPEVEVVADCDDLPNGIKAIKRLAPQLIFLDIEMPSYSGLEILDFFSEGEVNFDIIFTTAYDHYAIQAFKVSAVDYLLKPISPNELRAAVLRVINRNKRELEPLELLRQNLNSEANSKLAVPQLNGYRFIDHADILYLKGERAYATIFLNDGRSVLASRNLKYFEQLLTDSSKFFRCHRSFIVNVDHITEYVKTDGGNLILRGNRHVSVAADRVPFLLERLGR